jgi:fucose permease
VAEYHGSFAGILCTGIMEGAMVPLIMGAWATCLLRAGMAFLYVTFGCVLSVGFWAKLLITNAPSAPKRQWRRRQFE